MYEASRKARLNIKKGITTIYIMEIAAVVVDSVVAVIKEQVSYFLYYRRHVEELAIQVQELESATQQVRLVAEAGERNENEIRAEVRVWLDKVEDILKEAKPFLEKPNHANARCSCRSLFPDLGSRYRLSKKARGLATYTNHLIYSLSEIGRPVMSYTGGTLKLESRESLMNEIMKSLIDPNVSRVGVYGLAGIGKTTLVKQLARQVSLEKLFDVVIMTSSSETSDIKVIQGEIAGMLGIRFEEVTEAGRARRLNLRLKTEQNILIIVDDVWAKLDLEKLGIPSASEHKGCKQLLTSRNQAVLREMETQQDFELQVLSGREMWRFYQVIGSEVVEDAILLRNIADIAAECVGFPDHAMTVALALRNKDIHSCKYALNQLERFNNKQKNEIIYSALELSYNQLESDEMKALFLLCGVLGASSFVGDLLNFGIGLGIFKRTNTVKEARKELHEMIGQLREHCLLLEGDYTSDQVKMHHIVCEVVVSIASRQKHIFTINLGVELKKWPSEDFLKRCTQIIIDGCYIQKLPERFDCPELKLFYLKSATNGLLALPDSFFLGMGGLQVLGLTCMNMSSLPTSLGSLIDLKTLSLDHCALQNMTGIGALKNLEILTLTNSSFTFSYEFERLTSLRMLELSHSRIEHIPPKILPKWYQLEELYTGNTFIKWEFEDSSMQNKNASLSELKLLHKLTDLEIKVLDTRVMPMDNILMLEKLDRLKLAVGDEFECSEIKAGFSKTLKLQLGTSVQIEDWMKELMKRVDCLCLGETNGISNVLYQLNGEGLPLLKHLHVQNNATIQHIVNSIGDFQDAFPNLETMVLHNLSSLDEICHGPLTSHSFSELTVIRVKRCSLLQNLFSPSIIERVSNLVEIEVSECNSLKAIVADISGFRVQFRQLRSLTLHHLPALFGFNSHDQTSQTEQKLLFNSEVW